LFVVEDTSPVIDDYGINCIIKMDTPNTNGMTDIECDYITITSDETGY